MQNTVLQSASDSACGTLFRYKAWADAEAMALLCQPLDKPTDECRSQHSQALRLMNHIHVVDRIFIAHLSATPHAYTATNTAHTPTPEQLSLDLKETGAWLLRHATQATAQDMNDSLAFTFTDGDAGRMTRLEMLLHLNAHGTYHRGQVSQMLKTIGLAPPRELLTRMLHWQEPWRREQCQ